MQHNKFRAALAVMLATSMSVSTVPTAAFAQALAGDASGAAVAATATAADETPGAGEGQDGAEGEGDGGSNGNGDQGAGNGNGNGDGNGDANGNDAEKPGEGEGDSGDDGLGGGDDGTGNGEQPGSGNGDGDASTPGDGNGDGDGDDAVVPATPATLYGMAHRENYGWSKDYLSLTQTNATTTTILGEANSGLRLEALRFYVDVNGTTYGITTKAHVENEGWLTSVSDAKAMVGSTGKGQRIEALSFELPEELSGTYQLLYRVYVQGEGWLDWTSDGEVAGSEGCALRIEAVELRLVDATSENVPTQGDTAFFTPTLKGTTHVENVGTNLVFSHLNQTTVTLGTTGQGLRLEDFTLAINSDIAGSLEYAAHVENYGWSSKFLSAGTSAGTQGQGLRVEAVKFQLTGELANTYDVYYRAHVENFGWLGWAKNGEVAGTSGAGLRVESIEIQLVAKGAAAPGSTAIASIESGITVSGTVGTLAQGASSYATAALGSTAGSTGQGLALTGFQVALKDTQSIGGGISYKGHFANVGWVDAVANGAACEGAGNRLEAVQIAIHEGYAAYFDVYYRVHVSNYGWTGWAMNAELAGSTGCGRAVEALEVVVVPKGSAAPGSRANVFSDENGFLRTRYSSGNAELDGILTSIINTRVGTGSDKLRRAFDYVANNYNYRTIAGSPSGNWKVNYALELYKAGSGNCYRFSALFYQLARALDYDARLIVGSIKTSAGNDPHCWVEVNVGGTWYVYDPDMQRAYKTPGLNWFQMTYSNSPVYYNRNSATVVY